MPATSLVAQVLVADGAGNPGNARQPPEQNPFAQQTVDQSDDKSRKDAADAEPQLHALFPIDEKLGVDGKHEPHAETEGEK